MNDSLNGKENYKRYQTVDKLREEAFRLIESKDISDHLKKIKYKFSDTYIAFLVSICDRLSIDERHHAWTILLEGCSAPELSSLLKQKIESEDQLIKLFTGPGVSGYSCLYWHNTGKSKAVDYRYDTIDDCLKECAKEKGVIYLEISRQVESTKTVYVMMRPDGKITRIAADGILSIYEKAPLRSFCFPCPFKRGEALKRINGEGIFADQPLRFIECRCDRNHGMLACCEYYDAYGEKHISGIPIFDLERY